MKVLVDTDPTLVVPDERGVTADEHVDRALAVWDELENPEEVLAAYRERESPDDTRREVTARE